MGTLPRARVRRADTAGSFASGAELIAVWGPVSTNYDITPRIFGSAEAFVDLHGYCEAADYVAFHIEQTGKSVLFLGLPVETPGAIGRENTSGNSGTSVSTVQAPASGVMAQHSGILSVVVGGTVGTDLITLGLSLDGGRTTQRIRIGTATTYTIPFYNVVISLTVGTLVAGDTIHTWVGSSPTVSSASLIAARNALAADDKLFRIGLHIPVLASAQEANTLMAQAEAYYSDNERETRFLAQSYDRLPQAELSALTWRMTAGTALTFSTDSVVRATGSWLAEGFAVGDTITVSGTASNDGSYVITSLDATTLGATGLVAEAPLSVATVVGEATLTFAAAGSTITRSRGSWLDDGFRVGDVFTLVGSVSNDSLTDSAITVLSATVLTTDGTVVNETIGATAVELTAGQSMTEWIADVDQTFSAANQSHRLDIAVGYGRLTSPLTSWYQRFPAAWAESLRIFQHDLHVPAWRKADGSTGFDLRDAAGKLVEYDDRAYGGAACAGNFTSLRTYDGDSGSFVTETYTRAAEGDVLVQSHNVDVVNEALMVTKRYTELVIGETLIVEEGGVNATEDSLTTIERVVNSALQTEMLQNRGEGPRVSSIRWQASRDDDLITPPEPILTGVLLITRRGVVHSVATAAKI